MCSADVASRAVVIKTDVFCDGSDAGGQRGRRMGGGGGGGGGGGAGGVGGWVRVRVGAGRGGLWVGHVDGKRGVCGVVTIRN